MSSSVFSYKDHFVTRTNLTEGDQVGFCGWGGRGGEGRGWIPGLNGPEGVVGSNTLLRTLGLLLDQAAGRVGCLPPLEEARLALRAPPVIEFHPFGPVLAGQGGVGRGQRWTGFILGVRRGESQGGLLKCVPFCQVFSLGATGGSLKSHEWPCELSPLEPWLSNF